MANSCFDRMADGKTPFPRRATSHTLVSSVNKVLLISLLLIISLCFPSGRWYHVVSFVSIILSTCFQDDDDQLARN